MQVFRSPTVVLVLILQWMAGCAYAIQITFVTPVSWRAGSVAPIAWDIDESASGASMDDYGRIYLMKVNGNPKNLSTVIDLGNVRPDTQPHHWVVPGTIMNGEDYVLRWQWVGKSSSNDRYSGSFKIWNGSNQSSSFPPAMPTTTTPIHHALETHLDPKNQLQENPTSSKPSSEPLQLDEHGNPINHAVRCCSSVVLVLSMAMVVKILL